MLGRTVVLSLGAAVLAACTPAVRAADPPKKTLFVINESVEVPGMVLDPGRYVLKLVEPGAERNVLQVFEVVQLWTGDEGRLLSTLLTMPNYDRPTTDKTVFIFFERSAKQSKALRLWFPPGRNCGQEFVYPKAQAVELAKAVGRGVLSMPPELPGDIGRLGVAVQRGVAAPAPATMNAPAALPLAPVRAPMRVPAAQPLAPARATMPPPAPQPVLARPVSVAPVAQEQPPQKTPPPPLSPRLSTSVSVRGVNEAPGGAASSAIQSRSREISRAAPQAPETIAAALPKTAGYLPLGTLLGIAGILSGILLRILALRLERQ